MEHLRTTVGRYVPTPSHRAHDADRLRRLEQYLAQQSEETEYILATIARMLSELQERVGKLETGAGSAEETEE